jgi:hypothetical protein
MKKFLATLGMVGLLTLNIGTVFAAAPTITSITPSFGPTAGGTSVTIVGTNLEGASITIGGVTATDVVVAGDNQSLTATTPAAGPAAEDVVVTTIDGSATLEAGFTYTDATSTATTTFTLTYAAGANGSITGSSTQIVDSGSSGAAVTATADAGFHFVDWSDSSTSNPRTDASVSANVSVTANFAADDSPTATSTPACNGSTFDTFATGTVDGQGGWHVSGDFDQEVIPNYNYFGYPTFGCQTFRISDATTSVFIFNQTFSNAASNEAGETDAVGGDTPIGTRQNHFDAQFDIGTASSDEQPGLHLSVSPDRGDGTRMSSIGINDTAAGLDVFFNDVTGTTSPVTFNEVQIATGLSRLTPHTIKYSMDFIDGESNDVVKIYIDGTLVHTGTSWENFYRYDNDAFPAPDNKSRTVSSLVFYERGTAHEPNRWNGFVIDNVSLSATTTATTTPPVSTSTPVITLNGSSTMNVVVNTSFTDPGATATDEEDGTVAVVATGTVDIAVVGGYTITYTATDSDDNVASTTRTVNVVATSSIPIVTLNGSSSVSVMVNTEFVDPGATAMDNEDGSLAVTATGTVNTNAIGDYTRTYSATDSDGNTGTTTRTIHVIAGSPSGGGGGGGGGGFFLFLPSTTTTQNPPTPSSPITIGSITTPTGQVLGVSIFNFSRNLKFGMTGNDVTELQKILIAGGYLQILVPTKFFGKLTEKALMKWQKQNKLPSTGYFGQLSRALIAK